MSFDNIPIFTCRTSWLSVAIICYLYIIARRQMPLLDGSTGKFRMHLTMGLEDSRLQYPTEKKKKQSQNHSTKKELRLHVLSNPTNQHHLLVWNLNIHICSLDKSSKETNTNKWTRLGMQTWNSRCLGKKKTQVAMISNTHRLTWIFLTMLLPTCFHKAHQFRSFSQ